MSVNGAEEDGVDNRVEAPTRAPDEGSDSKAPDQQADDSTDMTPESPEAASTAPDFAAPLADSDPPADTPSVAPRATPVVGTPADGQSPAIAPSLMSTPQPAPDFSVPSPPQPDTLALGQASQALSQSSQVRGIAAKISAPFSTLSRPRTRTPAAKPRKPPPRRPASGPPPRPTMPQARYAPGQRTGPQTRRAQLKLDRIEPWSVMKFSFLMSLVGWVILFVVVAVLYFALSKLGVFTSIEHTVTLVTGNKTNPAGSNPRNWFKASRVLGYTMLVGAVNVVLMTALATVGAVLYNLVTMLAGGIEVTLKESD